MSRHIFEPALPEHLHRGRSSRYPSLASRLVRDGITVVRKECSETSPLEVWVDHCSLSMIIGLGLISVLARKAQTLNECRKPFHVHALDSWRHVM